MSHSTHHAPVSTIIRLPDEMEQQLKRVLYDIFYSHARAINAAIEYDITSIASAATVAHDLVLVSTGASNLIVGLPPADDYAKRPIRIKKVDAGVGKVLIDTAGSETIDGAASYTVSSQWQLAVLLSDGANWYDLNV